MGLRRFVLPLVVTAVAAALIGAAAVAQYSPLVGMPLVVVVGLGALWLLATHGADL